MAMTQREKILSIGVGTVVGLLAVQFIFSSIRGGFDRKQIILEDLNKKITDHTKVINNGILAHRKINELVSKSLPKDQDAALNQYQTWLVGTANECGMQSVQLGKTETDLIKSDAFTSYRFSLTGDIRINDQIKFLHKYYERDYLHRLRTFKFTQSANDPEFGRLQIVSQVLALKKASAKQEPSLASSGRLTKSVDEYQALILARNPFSPPNNAPNFTVSSSHDVPRDRDWNLELKATDPDGRHKVSYKLLSEKPSGLRFSEDSGSVSWTPTANGTYELLVEAVDNGFPPKTAQKKLTLRVIDPPTAPPPVETPKFDASSQSFVTAIVSGRNGAQVWIRSKTDNNTYKVTKGDEISIGSIKGKIVDVNVDEQFAEVESDGKRWILSMDESVLNQFKKAKED